MNSSKYLELTLRGSELEGTRNTLKLETYSHSEEIRYFCVRQVAHSTNFDVRNQTELDQ